MPRLPLRVLVLMAGLSISCYASPDPTAPVTTQLPAASATISPDLLSSIVRTEETDEMADGSVDRRKVATVSYDAHGNKISEVVEWTRPPVLRTKTLYEYNARGAVLGYVAEEDRGLDGTIDRTEVMTTVERDARGNPVRQVIDYSGAGHVTEVTNEFDSRGRLVVRTDWANVIRYEYDAHNNVTRSYGSGFDPPFRSFHVVNEFTSQNALVASSGRYSSEAGNSVNVLTTMEYDVAGYPVVQIDQWKDSSGGSDQRITRAFVYDRFHRVLVQTDDIDDSVDGTVDRRITVSYAYGGVAGNPKSRPEREPIATVSR